MMYSIVVSGIGFTGLKVLEYLKENASKEVKIAISGRNEQKLKDILKQMNLVGVYDYIVCDLDDDASVEAMVTKTKCVIACSGPFALMGERIIKNCAKHGVDYVDITGEGEWVLRMKSLYHEEALRSHAMIVPCSGNDCVPSDIAAWHAVQGISPAIRKQGHHLRVYTVADLVHTKEGGFASGVPVSYGTYQTMLNMLRQGFLNKRLDPPNMDRVLLGSGGPQNMKGITICPTDVMPDAQICRHTFSLLPDKPKSYEIHYSIWMPNRVSAWVTYFFLYYVLPVCRYIPGFITFLSKLMKPGQGATTISLIKMYGFAQAYKLDLDENVGDQVSNAQTILVSQLDPYTFTGVSAAKIALAIATDKQHLAGNQGGFLTPVAALGGNRIIELFKDVISLKYA